MKRDLLEKVQGKEEIPEFRYITHCHLGKRHLPNILQNII